MTILALDETKRSTRFLLALPHQELLRSLSVRAGYAMGKKIAIVQSSYIPWNQ